MPKRKSLVCQHLENISRKALEKYQDIVREYIRGRQGIYALYRRDKLYYVGLTGDLRSRLKHHLRDRHKQSWDRFSVYLTIGDDHIKELESLVLRIVNPPGNSASGKFQKSENLKRRFTRDIRNRQQEELDALVGRKRKKVVKKRKHRKLKKAGNGRTPVLLKYIDGPMKIRSQYKGKMIRARIRRDGAIRLNGTLYTSPSLAGAAACKRVSCNGWRFWQYERAPGDWVPLSILRR